MEEKLGTEEDPVTHGFTISSEHHTDAGSDSSDAEKPKEDDDFRRKIKHAAGTSHTLSGSEEHGSDAEGTQEAVVSGKGFRVVTSEMQNSDQEIDVDDAHSSPVGADEFKPSSTNDSEAEISDDEPLVLIFHLHSASYLSYICIFQIVNSVFRLQGAWKRRVVKSAAGKSQ